MRFKKAAGALGAFAEGVQLNKVAESADAFAEVHAALLEHEVLFFRDQELTPGAYERLGARFGRIEVHPAYPVVAEAPQVQILESTAAAPSKIEAWHTDMTFRSTPPMITMLHGQIIPAFGGDTLWASITASYDALSAPLQGLLDGLQAVHDFRHGFQESLAEPGGPERLAGATAANPPLLHPVIAVHPETGRKAIYVNPLFTTRIEGLGRGESRALLDFFYRHVVTDEFTVRLNWSPGTVAIWDNRSTQHKPVNDFFPQHRRMHRITIQGARPVGVSAQSVGGA
ncbi:MAG: TauD/TfdA family dioxygenase [Pseudomonadales bacterium]|nr:TauD/TfdA family dioxygenase [Pseudomonadales bacterium]